jgi:hypothetical protein
VDENGESSSGRWDYDAGLINRFNVWKRGVSISVFLKSKIIEIIGGFDEMLGVGAYIPCGSGEETDYLLRTLEEAVYHPHFTVYCNNAIKRARLYAQGMGCVLQKHNYPFCLVCIISVSSPCWWYFIVLTASSFCRIFRNHSPMYPKGQRVLGQLKIKPAMTYAL